MSEQQNDPTPEEQDLDEEGYFEDDSEVEFLVPLVIDRKGGIHVVFEEDSTLTQQQVDMLKKILAIEDASYLLLSVLWIEIWLQTAAYFVADLYEELYEKYFGDKK